MTDEVLYGQCAVEENAEAFDSQRDGLWYRQTEGVDRNRGQFLSCSSEHHFCLFTI